MDQTDDLPFKARVTPDKVEFALAEIAAQNIALLIEACVNGRREAFIAEHFGPDYPKDLDNESIVLDLMWSASGPHGETMNCLERKEFTGGTWRVTVGYGDLLGIQSM